MASRVCSLDNSAINIGVFREDSRRELFNILDGLRDKERPNLSLILDPELGGLFQHILVEGASVLKDHGVSHFRELTPDYVPDSNSGCDITIFIVRPVPAAVFGIATIVKGAYDYTIYVCMYVYTDIDWSKEKSINR
jgi:hypothetical protein